MSEDTTISAARFDRTKGRIGTANDLFEMGKKAHAWWRARTTYTVSIPDTDPLFGAVRDWVTTAVQPTHRRALIARTQDHHGGHPEQPVALDSAVPPADEPRGITVGVGDGVAYTLTLNGHPLQATTNPQSFGQDYRTIPGNITLLTRTLDGQHAVLAHLATLAEQRRTQPRRPELMILDRWGSWSGLGYLPPRDLGTVVLANGQIERLTGDLDRFLASESTYARRGLPWHRGYLFEGPPGTGKTSVAKALATHFGLDLYFAPLGDLDKDAKLISLIAGLRQRSVLLLEDVDVFAATHAREAETGTASLSGLLNALDGVATPHGLITILTTNNASVLDEALTRAGRIDMREHLGLPDAEQAGRVFANFYDHPAAPMPCAVGLSPAEIVEVCKQNEHTPNDAVDQIAARTRVLATATGAAHRPTIADGGGSLRRMHLVPGAE